MLSATTASLDDEFISERLLAFMNNVDYNVMSNNKGSNNGINMIGLPASAQKTFSLDKNGALALATKNSVSCNSPTHQMNSVSGFGAITSPSVLNKYAAGGLSSAFSTPNTKMVDDYHSLQNSPFYNQYPVNGNFHPLKRQNCGNFLLNTSGVSPRDTLECQMPPPRQGPQRELFPSMSMSRCDSSWVNGLASLNHASGLLVQDRLRYCGIAQKQGFIVGPELDRIKENSRRSTSLTYGRISAHFRNRYGETEATTKAAYMQLGVRVPSKDHVSEIVGKGGQKIKLIREETGALITTPGEYEDHVFIIEAPPEIALRVADLIASRAQEITQSKLSASERRRGSTSSVSGSGAPLFTGINGVISSSTVPSVSSSCISSSFLNGQQPTASRSPDDLTSLPSPSPIMKGSPGGILLNTITQNNPGTVSSQTGDANSFNGFTQHTLANGTGSSASGRILLARSKISVPQDMVGKIIGTQGSIITTIQKDTGTEIKSPPKEAARGPAATSEFEISAYQSLGMTSNQAAECRVQQAKQLIGHLVMRQFERRASEDLEDHSSSASTGGRKNSAGTDDSPDQLLPSLCNGRGNWMWPEVAQMDSSEAREVLDRILAESKSKTRRAKELAAASSVPPSPGGGVMPVGFNGGVDMFSEKTMSSASAATPSMSISCHTSPFHQSSSVRGIPTNYHPQQTQTSHMLNGYMHDRLHSACDYSDSPDFDQQSYMHLNGNGNSANGASTGHSAFWQQQIVDHPLAHHSFSAGHSRKTVLEEHNGLSQSPRRHADFTGLNRGGVDLTLASLSESLVKDNKSSNHDWSTTNRNNCLNTDGQAFDFINAFDRMGLGSSELDLASVTDLLSYPPGFDMSSALQNGRSGSSRDLGRHDWSTSNRTTGDSIGSSLLNGIFTNGNGGSCGGNKSGSDFSDGSGSGQGDPLQNSNAVRSIWSDSVSTGDAGSGSSGIFSSLAFSQSVINSFATNSNGSHSNNNRCGAIGEGRRRSTPPQATSYSPVSSANGLGDALTSVVATIPAV